MRTTTLCLLAFLAVTNAGAGVLYVTPDTPADLSGSVFKASDILRADGPHYTLERALPANARIDALQRMASGDWLVSLEAPATLGGTAYDPRDVLRYNGTGFSLFFGGAANGIPAGANVDAVALFGSDTGPLFLSVDVPARIGGLEVEPADVLRFAAGTFTLHFDAPAATPPIPSGTNVVGLDKLTTSLLLSFDVPTTLGPRTSLPGDIVEWTGTVFSAFRRAQPNDWGIQHELAGVSTPTAAGTAADLRVRRTGNQLVVRWAQSCSAWANDYGIYTGALGNFASHTATDCADDLHDLTETIPTPGGNRYFLVVPLTARAEGSYGVDSSGAERARGTATCRASQAPPVCP
jgi:hypothetical protein